MGFRVASTTGVLCLLTASILGGQHVFAQTAPSSGQTTGSDQSATSLEEVTVTGSRIKRATDFTAATPTTVLDATTIENLGIVNVGDTLNVTPSNISSVTPATTGNSAFNTGAYIADLRGLNPFFGSRTLTLIDNQRAVSTSTVDSFDLNFVPQVLVQRIDTVTGGGSAIYGSGAVGGVVNIILDHQLEGGKFNADEYDTHYNDAKSAHVSAAYGHGLFDNRVHFVIGAEYQKQDPASCQFSGRSWCNSDTGPYDTGFTPGFSTFTSAIGSGLTTNTSTNSVISAAVPGFPSYVLNTSGSLYTGAPGGVALLPFQSNNSFLNITASPGGNGEPANQYTNLVTAVQRAVISGLITVKVTDSINAHLDLNWGKVNSFNPSDNFGSDSGVLGNDNPYLLAAGGAAAWGPGGTAYGTGPTAAPAAFFQKDFSQQINFGQINDTTLKQVALGFDGKIGESSWTWDAHARYGQTVNLEAGQQFGILTTSMAVDAVTGANGAPECRVAGGLPGASASSVAAYGGGGLGGGAYPTYIQQYNAIAGGGFDPTSPVSGLTALQTLQVLSQGCLPLNAIGNSPISSATANYSASPLALLLHQNLTAFSLNATGDFWSGFGAGAFSVAAGYEWHRQLTHNDFSDCPGAKNSLSNSYLDTTQEDCLAVASDFAYQYGNDYGGSTTMNEVYAEFNLPLLKNMPFAKSLSLDIAGRETFYVNEALYGVDVVPGTQNTGSLPTWKAALVWEPIDGIRFRGSQSHDSRDPDPRDLYYSQTFVAGNPAFKGIFDAGYCEDGASTTTVQESLCTTDLLGNIKLRPETSNTTDLGVVFTPPWLPGLQASADWFHVRLLNGIEGANLTGRTACYAAIQNVGAASAFANNNYCQGLVFNNQYYNSAGDVVPAGTPGAVTGANAFALGNVANITQENTQAYNGGSFDERGIDFSLAYGMALPGSAGTLTARALTTWVGEQMVVDTPGNQPVSVLGETGANALFLPNYQPAARWRGNMSITWNVQNFSLTPNLSWVGQGIIGTNDISCTTADYSVAGSLCQLASNGVATGTAAQRAYYNSASAIAPLTILPVGVANHVPSYFLVGLNASYVFTTIPGLKGLQLWGQVNNLLNKAPPNADSLTSNPVFFDQLGQAYRVGFRMTF
ncbi:MAG TPA: TonB-dependent receptor [Steroidobacteraceae bacterium]|nr:TonB-dependent receptor [Steroidobacteraceae bacterium]